METTLFQKMDDLLTVTTESIKYKCLSIIYSICYLRENLVFLKKFTECFKIKALIKYLKTWLTEIRQSDWLVAVI